MKLTQTLLSFLTDAFWTDPSAFVALVFRYGVGGFGGGTMTWTVADGFLTTAVTGGAGANLNIDLSQYTIDGLVAFIAAQTGYVVTFVDPTANATLGALVLLDGTGGNGQPVLGYATLLYAYMEAQAYELEQLQNTIADAPAQLSILNNGAPSAEGFFLDTLGTYYGAFGRDDSETDKHYSNRLVASIVDIACNNVAIELAVTRYTNKPTTVADVATWTGGPTFNGAFNYNGSNSYNSAATVQYNLFDVSYSYDFSDGADPAYVLSVVQRIVAASRASGCFPRNFTLV